jgi:tripartite-type tricarboxylate transporter receptor subunit TctC
MSFIRRVFLFALASVSMCAGAQTAANWPSRPIKMIVPFPAGGGYDFMARNLAQRLTDSLGQPVVVENRAGANGNIGSDAVAKAAPDGYTLLLGGIGPQAFSVALYPKLPFDPQRDFAPISLVASQPNLLLTHPSLAVKSVAELVALAKARPGELTFGSTGNGSGQHFGLEQLKAVSGIEVINVPYKGAAPLHMALLANEVKVAFNIIQLPMQQVRRGELRALAVASKKRSPLAPDVPTMTELGYPIDFDTWYAVFAPAETPRGIVDKLNGAVLRALADPAFKESTSGLGIDLIGSSPEQLGSHMRQEITRWSALAKAANIKAE